MKYNSYLVRDMCFLHVGKLEVPYNTPSTSLVFEEESVHFITAILFSKQKIKIALMRI
jgi:hypothetical protein